MQKLVSIAIAAVLLLIGQAARAQATPVTGLLTRVEVHVASAQIRFRVAGQRMCGSGLEAYFPIAVPTAIGPYTYSQTLVDALRSAVYTARASSIEVDVYAVPNGAECLVTDIVLK